MSNLVRFVGEARKALVAILGVVAQLVALGVLHGDALHWAEVVIACATAAGVYQTPNDPRTVRIVNN